MPGVILWKILLIVAMGLLPIGTLGIMLDESRLHLWISAVVVGVIILFLSILLRALEETRAGTGG